MSGRYERKKPQNQSTGGWKKTVLIVVLVIVVLIAALVVAGVVYYNSMLNKMNQVQVPTISRTDDGAGGDDGCYGSDSRHGGDDGCYRAACCFQRGLYQYSSGWSGCP